MLDSGKRYLLQEPYTHASVLPYAETGPYDTMHANSDHP